MEQTLTGSDTIAPTSTKNALTETGTIVFTNPAPYPVPSDEIGPTSTR